MNLKILGKDNDHFVDQKNQVRGFKTGKWKVAFFSEEVCDIMRWPFFRQIMQLMVRPPVLAGNEP